MPKRTRSDCVVTKSFSLPIGILKRLLDEADLMGCTLSEATTRLLILGLAQKATQRQHDETEINEEEKRILKQVKP